MSDADFFLTGTAMTSTDGRVRSPLELHGVAMQPEAMQQPNGEEAFWQRREVPLHTKLCIWGGGMLGGLLGGFAAAVCAVYIGIATSLLNFQLLAAAYVALGVALICVVLCSCCGCAYSRRAARRRATVKPRVPAPAQREFAPGGANCFSGWSWAAYGGCAYALTLALAVWYARDHRPTAYNPQLTC